MKIELPADIKRKVNKKIISKMIVFVLLESLLSYLFIVLPDLEKVTEGYVLMYILVLLLPVYVTRIHKVLFDRSWHGKIIEVSIKSLPVKLRNTNRGPYYSWDDVLCLTILTDNGHIKEYKLKSFTPDNTTVHHTPSELSLERGTKNKITDYIDRYKAGDFVWHFYGIDNLLLVKKDETQKSVCLICGLTNHNDNEKCVNCGYTLIKVQ